MQKSYNKKTTLSSIALIFAIFLILFFLFSTYSNSGHLVAYAETGYVSSVNNRQELHAGRIKLSTKQRNISNPKIGVDFLASNDSINNSFSDSKITLQGGHLVASIPIITNSSGAGIYNALKSNGLLMATVQFSYEVKMLAKQSADDGLISYIGFSVNNTSANLASTLNPNDFEIISSATGATDGDHIDPKKIAAGSATESISHNLGASNGYISTGYTNVNGNNKFSIPINHLTDVSNPVIVLAIKLANSDMKVEVSNIYLDVNVSFGTNSISISNDTSISISGSDRQTTSIAPKLSPPLMDTFIKSGDELTIKYGLSKNSTHYPLEQFLVDLPNFSKIFDSPYTATDVFWRYFVRKNDLGSEKNEVLRLISSTIVNEGEQNTPSFKSYGVVTFRVQPSGVVAGGPDENKLYLIPRLFSSNINGSIDYINYQSTSDFESFIAHSSNDIWEFTIDNNRPNEAKIDENCEFGKSIADQKWFTKSSIVNFRLLESSYNINATLDENSVRKDSVERLYTLVLPSNVSTVSIDNIDFSQTSPTYSLGGRTYPVTHISTMGEFSPNADKFTLEFTELEVSTLVLIIVDAVGNISIPYIYSSNNGNAVRVDNSNKLMRLIPYIAGEQMPLQSRDIYGKSTYYIDKPSLYDENGELKTNLPTEGSFTTFDHNFKRDAKIVIRFFMEEDHLEKYVLTRYNNVNNTPGLSVDRAIPREGVRAGNKKYLYFDMKYTVLDADWQNDSGFDINLHFGELVNIVHDGTEYMFKIGYNEYGIAQDITDDFNAYTKPRNTSTNPVQISPRPDFEVQYFNIEKYTITAFKVNKELTGEATVVFDSDISTSISISIATSIPMKNKNYTFTIAGRKLTTLFKAEKSLESNDSADIYTITAIEIDKPKDAAFIDAGKYGYRIFIKTQDNSRYYGEDIGEYEIKKANPTIKQLEQSGQLTFGDSLSQVLFKSRKSNNEIIYDETAEIINGVKYFPCAINGLFGTFSVSNPGLSSPDYIKPNSSESYRIRVEYQPIDVINLTNEAISQNRDFYSKYFDLNPDGNYILRQGALHAGNYDRIDIEINIVILKKQVSVIQRDQGGEVDGIIYDGDPKSIEFYASDGEIEMPTQTPTMDFEEKKNSVVISVRYREIVGETFAEWTTTAPHQAGNYEVEGKIDSSRCNFKSEVVSVFMTIKKKTLKIGLDTELSWVEELDEYNIPSLEVVGRYEIRYTYLNINRPIIHAYDTSMPVGEDSIVAISERNYHYSIYSIATSTWEHFNLVNALPRDLDVTNEGYILKVEISNKNYFGVEHIRFFVQAPSDALLTPPSIDLTAKYETYNLENTSLGKTGHLEFGEFLSESHDIFDYSSEKKVVFKPENLPEREIDGRFYFETEEQFYSRNSNLTKIYSPVYPNRLVLPVVYNGNNIVTQKIGVYWEAGSYNSENVFIKNNNFAVYRTEIDIIVVRAKLDFTEVKHNEITYGTPLDSSALSGNIKSHGYNIPASYYSLTLADENDELKILDGGDKLINYSFSFIEEYQDLVRRYYFERVIEIPIKVNPQVVSIYIDDAIATVAEGDLDSFVGESGLIYEYSLENAPPENIVVKNSADEIIENIRLDFVYYRERTDDNDFGDNSIGEFYDLEYPDYIKIQNINRNTLPGKYWVIIKTSDNVKNYTSKKEVKCFVIKSTLSLPNSYILPSLEYGYHLNEQNHLLKGINLVNKNDINPLIIAGDIIFEENLLLEEIGHFNYRVKFSPTSNDSLYQYFKKFDREIEFNVIKRSVDFEIESLDFVYNSRTHRPVVKIKDPITNNYLSDEELSSILVYKFANQDGILLDTAPSNAGIYYMTVSITTENILQAQFLQGSVYKQILINKAQVDFAADDIINIYSGSIQNPSPEFTVVGINNIELNESHLEKTYKNIYGVAVNPLRVGKYLMNVVVNHENYIGEKNNIVFYIAPNVKGYKYTIQDFKEYNIGGRLRDVEVEFNSVIVNESEAPHQNVVYSIEYKYEGYQSWLPLSQSNEQSINSGTHLFRVKYSQDGYDKIVEKDNNNQVLRFVVNKASIDFSIYNIENQHREYVYIGAPIRVTLLIGQFSTNATYKFKPYDNDLDYDDQIATEDGYSNELINAGKYVAKLEVNTSNYFGITHTIITVRKATLIIEEVPTLADSYRIVFGTRSQDIPINQNSGKVVWVKSNQQIPVNDFGDWELITDTSILLTGSYRIDVMFRLNESNANNFIMPTTKINAVIHKRDISDKIIVNTDSLIQEYRDAELAAIVSLNREGIVANYGEIKLASYYNESTNSPKAVGEYSLKIKVVDSNYTGETTDNFRFIIKQAKPQISELPTIKPKNINDTLSPEDINSDGRAVIFNTDKRVPGQFRIHTEEVGRTLNKANEHDVRVEFVPTDPTLYLNNIVTVKVKVKGVDPIITNIEVQPINLPYYGTPLSNFAISCSSSVTGTIEWEDGTIIPDVGQEVYYIFTPNHSNIDQYNIIREKTTVPIIKKQMNIDPTKSYIKVYINQSIEEAVNNGQFYMSLSDAENGVEVQNYSIDIETSDPNTSIKVSEEDVGKLFFACKLTIKHKNYNDLSNIDILSWALKEIESSDFVFIKNSKDYDAEPIDVYQYLRINNTSYEINQEHRKIYKILDSRNEVVSLEDTYKADTYRIFVRVDERQYVDGGLSLGRYFGESELSFVVKKRDVTSIISLTNGEIRFLDTHLNTEFNVEGEILSKSNLIISYYRASNNTPLGSFQPRSVGQYYMLVKVIENHPSYFSSEKRFEYEVTKATLNISFSRQSYIADFGKQYNIVPEFYYILNGEKKYVSLTYEQSYNISYFYKLGENTEEQVQKAENAGEYRVRVEINDDENYVGSNYVSLLINKAKTNIQALPNIPTGIKYGIPLGAIILTGGSAVELVNDTPLDGEFKFADGSAILDAGAHPRVQISFIPKSPNHEVSTEYMELTIQKQTITFDFSNLNTYYNGEIQWPTITSSLSALTNIPKKAYLNGIPLDAPKNSGVYTIIVEVNEANYVGRREESFTILKGKISCKNKPDTTVVTFGNRLQQSTISGGVFEDKFILSEVNGTLKYKVPDSSMSNGVGTYQEIYIFTPNDSNYEVFEGVVDVVVVKRKLEMRVSKNSFVYGDEITTPDIKILGGEHAQINNTEFENARDSNMINVVGQYGPYRAIIDHAHYSGEVEYHINIIARVVELDYQLIDGSEYKIVSSYKTEYAQTLNYAIRVRQSSLAEFDIDKSDEISSRISVEYSKATGGIRFVSMPKSIGGYIIYPRLLDDNYILKSDEKINFEVVRANVVLSFDQLSLTQQVYGSVGTMPRVITYPVGSDVNIKISYSGSEFMPQSAGTHRVKAEVDDPNYNPFQIDSLLIIKRKALIIDNIVAYDKSYDGLKDIKVAGSLSGVMQGDQVSLHMKAETEDGRVNVGVHRIKLVDYRISGLDESNYIVNKPSISTIEINIKQDVIYDHQTGSYVRTSAGFDPNVSVSFQEVKDIANKTNVLTNIIGQKAVVIRTILMKNGVESIVESPAKFYIKIPSSLLGAKKLTIEGRGNLAGQNINFVREDEYITFHAKTSGEVLIYANEFPYWIVIIASAALMLIIGLVAILIASPIRKRKKVTREVQKADEFKTAARELEIKATRQAERRELDRKRNWRK